jgi:hypothetical protein
MSRRRIAVVAIVLSLLAAGTAGAADFFIRDPRVEVQWQAGRSRRGPVVHGYVMNHTTANLTDVRLRIERLDAAGQPAGAEVRRLFGELPAFGRTSFEERVAAAPGYRLEVVSYTIVRAGL